MVVLLITEVNVYIYGLSQELSKAREKSGVQNRWYIYILKVFLRLMIFHSLWQIKHE